ncbi:MAG: hypothetical protein H6702_15665 [Myxococcales bacterium]|nr:hypothetical protein [Myxococcales bacterium]
MRALVTLLLPVVAGCAGAPTSCPATEAPRAEVLSAVGAGPTAQAAADAARAAVAAQVASALEARLEVSQAEVDGQGTQAVRQVVRTRARFDRAELIEVAALPACEGMPHRAHAVLDRARARDALTPEWQAAHDRLQAALARGAQAADSDGPAFTVAWGAARSAYDDAEAAAAPLVVIAGAPAALAEDRQAFRALQGRAEAVRAAHPVTLALDGLEADLQAPVGQALVRGLTALGLPAAPGATCEAGLLLRPQATVTCDRSPLGPRCRLGLQGSVTRCDGRPVAPLDLVGTKLAAVHPRSDDRARATLLEKTAAADLAGPLADALAAVLPVEAP